MSQKGFLVLERGPCFEGCWQGGESQAGEVVFNTSHSGYEEMSTDPSYYSQILITTSSMQGNYGESDQVWESEKIWIHGFICLQLQNSERDQSWLKKLDHHKVPILTDLDTREIILYLREQGTLWGALVQSDDEAKARVQAEKLIAQQKSAETDWAYLTSTEKTIYLPGERPQGPRLAVVDLGCKKNILRELQKRCQAVAVFPSRVGPEEIKNWNPNGVLLSNGPGDPADVEIAVDTLRCILGWRPVFGICMGHHIMARALGADTYKLKFGHRGSNHPVKDHISEEIYVTSQNHGYAVKSESLPKTVSVTHTNLNDGTVAGIACREKKCAAVQFHPESHPGPHDGVSLFDQFIENIT